MMAKSAADRMQAHRRRIREGRVTMAADVKLDRLVLALTEDGFLQQWDEHDRAAIDRAFGEMVEAFITSMIGPGVTP